MLQISEETALTCFDPVTAKEVLPSGVRERLEKHPEIKIMSLDSDKRKDEDARREALQTADAAVLCLPDDAAVAAVALAEGSDTVIVDASTAHRVAEGWQYGFPEMSSEQATSIAKSKRIANPGCYPTGKICKPPPPKAKGAQKGHNSQEYGKEPTATLQDVTPLPKPQPEEALKLLARLQHADGTWEPSEELALGLGLHVFALEIPRKPAQDVPAWSVVVSTTLACQALQRCISIIGSSKTDPSAGRSEALAVASEHSVLGSKVLDVAGEWLEAAWDKAKQHVRARQRHELDLKEQLKAKMAIHKTCEVCGTAYTAAVGKCTRCFPPERPTVDVDQDNRKWRSLPPAPLHVDWQQCEGALHVEGGSGGVTLLHVGEGVLVLKKQRMTAAAEFLAIQVAKAIGIRVADMRA
eukprot:s2679_g11.t1